MPTAKGATTVLKFGGGGFECWKREPRRRGGRARSPENYFDFLSKNGEFGAFWVALPRCMLFRTTAQESEAEEEGRERALVKDDILHW